MNRFILFSLFCVFTMCKGKTQPGPYKSFVESFSETRREGILTFADLLYSGKVMKKDVAVASVYNYDSSRLYCEQDIFNIEEEKVVGRVEEIYIPEECLKLDMGNYTILGYSSYECHADENLVYSILNLVTISKKYNIIDSLVAFKRSEYFININGLINTERKKIFLSTDSNDDLGIEAKLIKIKSNGKFEVIQVQHSKNIYLDDPQEQIEILGWSEFLNL